MSLARWEKPRRSNNTDALVTVAVRSRSPTRVDGAEQSAEHVGGGVFEALGVGEARRALTTSNIRSFACPRIDRTKQFSVDPCTHGRDPTWLARRPGGGTREWRPRTAALASGRATASASSRSCWLRSPGCAQVRLLRHSRPAMNNGCGGIGDQNLWCRPTESIEVRFAQCARCEGSANATSGRRARRPPSGVDPTSAVTTGLSASLRCVIGSPLGTEGLYRGALPPTRSDLVAAGIVLSAMSVACLPPWCPCRKTSGDQVRVPHRRVPGSLGYPGARNRGTQRSAWLLKRPCAQRLEPDRRRGSEVAGDWRDELRRRRRWWRGAPRLEPGARAVPRRSGGAGEVSAQGYRGVPMR